MKTRLIALLLSISLLQGCALIAVGAGATIAGLIIYDRRPMQTMAQDNNIANDIRKAIRNDKNLQRNSDVVVSTFNNTVLLAGRAQNAKVREQIIAIASNTPNVKRIFKEIEISGGPSALARSNDAWISTKVRGALLSAKGLRSASIKVVTVDSTVYLMGIVNHQQADLAANAARQVPGVRKVVKTFEYSNI
jgi:osmotically-inducible protein OsmY